MTVDPYGIREIGALASRIPGAIRLEIGDPWFTTPLHIVEAAAAAAAAGFTHYTPSAGYESLREAIAERLRHENGIRCSADQVVVTTGGTGAIFTALIELVGPGEEVLIPDPAWPYYHGMVQALRAHPVPYPLVSARAFEPDPEQLERLITPRTKALILNTPANPSGVVFAPKLLVAVAELADRHGIWLISDECYDSLVFDGEHVSTATLTDSERLLSVFTFSKAYAMTGWRVGYLLAQTEVAERIARMQEALVVNTSSVSQKAAEAALAGPQDIVQEMRSYYHSQRDTAAALLDDAGLPYVLPRATFYMLIGLPPRADSREFALSLLEERHVAVSPGTVFGAQGAGYVRIFLGGGADELAEGVARLAEAIRDAGTARAGRAGRRSRTRTPR